MHTCNANMVTVANVSEIVKTTMVRKEKTLLIKK